MDPKEFEKYQFLRLYSIDLDTALHTFRVLKRYRRDDVRFIILRDIAIAYARPFSANKGNFIPTDTLQQKHVPPASRALHKELLRLRNEQFAHTDLKFYNPKVARFGSETKKWYPMSFKGYDYNALLQQIDEIEHLIRAVEQSVNAEITKCEHAFP